MLASPEFWVALLTLAVTILVPIIASTLRLSRQLTVVDTRFASFGEQYQQEIAGIKHVIEQIQTVLASIAVDRERVAGMERRNDDRFKMLDQLLTAQQKMIDELRHGHGFVRES